MLSGSFARVRIDDIVEVLEARFPGALPADLGKRLAGLDRDELKQVLRRSATAASVNEAPSQFQLALNLAAKGVCQPQRG